MGITCQKCGTENGDKQKFCSACGKPLEASAPAVKPKSKEKSKTMVFGGAAASLGKEPEKNAAPTKAKSEAQKTMLGIAAAKGGDKKVPIAKIQSGTPSVKTSSAKPTGSAGGSKTMLGMAAVTAKAPSKSEGQRSAAGPAHKSTGSKTMLGMPALNLSTQEKTEDHRSVETERKRPATPATPAEADDAHDSPDDGDAPQGAPATEPMPALSDSGENAMEMKTAPISSPFADGLDDDDDVDDDEAYGEGPEDWPAPEEPSRNNGLLVAVIAAGVVAFLVVGALLYLLFFDSAPTVTPQIFPSPDGKSLVVALPFPEAPPGTSVQAVGQSVSVTNGNAQISLPLDQMKLGLNDILLTYLEPGESPQQITFPIVLRHTIKDDLSGLAAEKPFVTVSFQIAPNVQLAVEGNPVQVAQGVYAHKILVESIPGAATATGEVLMHKVPFQLIDAAGAVEQGEHVVAIPVTKLQVDRPAADAQVVSEAVICAGTVEAGATVTVNGTPVAVTAMGFSTTVPLPGMGEHALVVTARAPGKAPKSSTVKVTRVETLAPAIAEWSKDLDKDLDYPTIGREPNTHVGKKVKLNGRVVNINTEKGVTAFILYVGQGCPAKSKCAVYVVFKGETEAGLQSWVDVLGTVRGTRAVEMQNGVKIEVPAIDAAYVVKTDPKKSKKKKKKKK